MSRLSINFKQTPVFRPEKLIRDRKKGTKMFEAKVYIVLKKTVADPQGLTVKAALESLRFKEANEVRIGKLITIKLNLKDKKEAKAKLNQMCQKLLANPIIEDYSFQINEV